MLYELELVDWRKTFQPIDYSIDQRRNISTYQLIQLINASTFELSAICLHNIIG